MRGVTYQVDTDSADTRLLKTLIDVLFTSLPSKSVTTLAREAATCLQARGSVETRTRVTLGDILLACETSPSRGTGAGEGGGIVGADAPIAAWLAPAVVQGCAGGGGVTLGARGTHTLTTGAHTYTGTASWTELVSAVTSLTTSHQGSLTQPEIAAPTVETLGTFTQETAGLI